jgi:hypothetical protein
VNATPPFPSITQSGYTLTSSVADFYQWQFNTADIPGATDQTYSVMQSGYYTVVVSDSTGCVNSFTVYVLISGINDATSNFSFSVFSNPVSTSFTLEFPHYEEVTIAITNILGQIVFAEEINSAKEEIDVSALPAGMYVMSAQTATQKIEQKFLKQ